MINSAISRQVNNEQLEDRLQIKDNYKGHNGEC